MKKCRERLDFSCRYFQKHQNGFSGPSCLQWKGGMNAGREVGGRRDERGRESERARGKKGEREGGKEKARERF